MITTWVVAIVAVIGVLLKWRRPRLMRYRRPNLPVWVRCGLCFVWSHDATSRNIRVLMLLPGKAFRGAGVSERIVWIGDLTFLVNRGFSRVDGFMVEFDYIERRNWYHTGTLRQIKRAPHDYEGLREYLECASSKLELPVHGTDPVARHMVIREYVKLARHGFVELFEYSPPRGGGLCAFALLTRRGRKVIRVLDKAGVPRLSAPGALPASWCRHICPRDDDQILLLRRCSSPIRSRRVGSPWSPGAERGR